MELSFIYATDRTDVRDVFKQKANEEGSKTYELGKDFTAEGSSHIPLILFTRSRGWRV